MDALARRDDCHWHVISTRSRHEAGVKRQLLQKEIEPFLPTVTRWSRWKDRRRRIEWPLFPGYCFARFDPAGALTILGCSGAVSISSFERKDVPISRRPKTTGL